MTPSPKGTRAEGCQVWYYYIRVSETTFTSLVTAANAVDWLPQTMSSPDMFSFTIECGKLNILPTLLCNQSPGNKLNFINYMCSGELQKLEVNWRLSLPVAVTDIKLGGGDMYLLVLFLGRTLTDTVTNQQISICLVFGFI